MNDWQSVFRLVHGDIPDGPATYMDGSFDDVYVLASGSSFYQRCFPPGSIDLGFCATAMHWLTSTPTPIPDALHSACTADGAAQRAFSERAAKDWEHILLQRAHELGVLELQLVPVHLLRFRWPLRTQLAPTKLHLAAVDRIHALSAVVCLSPCFLQRRTDCFWRRAPLP